MTRQYLFGDTDLAARRLAVLAEAFAPTSRAFLGEHGLQQPRLAVDLGCGPGHTTHLVNETLDPGRAVGLDKSEHFIALARRTTTDTVSFRVRDVTEVPLPDGPSDLIYARLLLTHQEDPAPLIASWGTQLAPGGRMLLEEVDSVATDNDTFARYLGIVERMLAAEGHRLCVGPVLDAASVPHGLTRLASTVASLALPAATAARMFSMNIRTWKHNPFVRENCTPETIRELEAELDHLAKAPPAGTAIEWRMRQLVFERKR